MTRQTIVKWIEESAPGSLLDTALGRAGFSRLRSLGYERRPADLCQRLKLVFDVGPRYEPGALAHVLPQVVVESESLASLVLRMVPQGPLHDPSTGSLVLRSQLHNLAPKGPERDRGSRWFIYTAEDLPALLDEIGQFAIDHALPFLDRYRDVRALALGYEESDERLRPDRRLQLCLAAAFLYTGRPEKALRVMEDHFARPALRKQYATSFEFVRNWRPG